MTRTGQTKVVAQGGGGWINQDPVRVEIKGYFTHYKNSKGSVTIGHLPGRKYALSYASIGIYSEIYNSREAAEDRVYELLES